MSVSRWFILAALTVATPVQAEEGAEVDLNALVTKVETAYKDVKSLQADFTQTTRSAAMGDGPKQSGDVTLARPRKMRWVFEKPEERAFVTDGSTMWVWSKTDNQVIVTSELGAGAGDMTQLLEDLGKLDELFDVKLVENSAETYTLDLTPKVESQVKELKLVIGHNDSLLRTLIMTDAFENQTELQFANVRMNAPVDDGSFTFDIPAGAEVVKADGI